ncbi:MAG TPA: AAA family ATPase, partial [Solirubrobacteraceae bacterium]
RRAAAEVAARGGVLVDATFRRVGDREAFAAACDGASPALFIECRAPAHVLAERAIARERGERHASDAGLGVVLSERTSWEPLDEVRPRAHVIVRSDRPVEQLVAEIMAVLDERLWRSA